MWVFCSERRERQETCRGPTEPVLRDGCQWITRHKSYASRPEFPSEGCTEYPCTSGVTDKNIYYSQSPNCPLLKIEGRSYSTPLNGALNDQPTASFNSTAFTVPFCIYRLKQAKSGSVAVEPNRAMNDYDCSDNMTLHCQNMLGGNSLVFLLVCGANMRGCVSRRLAS